MSPPIRLFLNGKMHRSLRQQTLRQLRPFDEAVVAAVHILGEADGLEFSRVLQAVEVEVVHGIAAGRAVLVHDGEAGTAGAIGHAQHLAECLDERGLAGTEFTVEGEDAMLRIAVGYGPTETPDLEFLYGHGLRI